jgi:hypothetical protein
LRPQFSVAITVIALAGCSQTTPPPPAVPEPYASGLQLIEAMQNRYAGRWYRTITFAQVTTSFTPQGARDTAIWYEALLLPSRLRIDYDPIEAGNGMLVRADTQYVVQRGSVVRTIPRTNELLLLGFDIYFLEPAITAAWLTRLGFDLAKVRRTVWQGRDVYVVGANDPADLRSRQFWVDRENMLFVRLLTPARDSTQTDDIRFANYEQIGRAWVAPRVEVYRNGSLVFKEEYRHVRIDQPLDTALFDPAQWRTARHWYRDR